MEGSSGCREVVTLAVVVVMSIIMMFITGVS